MIIAALAVGAILVGCSTGGTGTDSTPVDPTTVVPTSEDSAEPDETSAVAQPSGEPRTADRYLYGVRTVAEGLGWSWDESFHEFRELAGTQPLDAETAAEAGELVRELYLPITGGIRYGGPEAMLDMITRTRDAMLLVTNPATPEMVLAVDAVLAEWEPFLEEIPPA
jgi:hypothetical protein